MAAHTKKGTIAREQLEDAVDLFFAKRYISCTTLLGAAEEMLGTVFKEKQGVDLLENEWRAVNRTRSLLGDPHLSKRDIQRLKKSGYNALKHYDPGEPDRLHVDGFKEAFMLLQRVTQMADHLEIRYSNRDVNQTWYDSNWST
ncbi:hypothetical protein BKP64_09920 [Marinobacter salinus]|uniref:HEPN domain-containing protein n=1 Tax=Marinobacter salinus TaxID=1874317 RepID=A0A1D9GLD3_9GAMM|nr:hypothetical protein [Marinobacter salinus]AOY88456.1 hypothetical protein BKP64_09920 [Marinobacter salinus]